MSMSFPHAGAPVSDTLPVLPRLAPFSFLDLPAYQKALFIRYGYIFFCDRIITAHNEVITDITVYAGAAADQCPMDFTDPKEVAA